MMQRKYLILILAVTVALLAGAAVAVYVTQTSGHAKQVKQDEHNTNTHVVFEDETPIADPAIVGRWQNAANPQWIRVYLDDYDGDGFFWGKEWDEAEDVHEEDLNYHGNGWFRWEKKGKVIREYATMDTRDVPIHHAYKILFSSADSLCYGEADYRNAVYEFVKAE